MARKPIDKNIRSNVWRRYWGSSADGQCWVCGRPIHIEMFESGHIVSAANKGGDDVLNLVPICGSCNKGMGKENLLDYKKRAFPHINVQSLVQPESPNIYIKEKETISQTTKMSARPIENDIEDQQQSTVVTQPIDEEFSEKDKKERYGKYTSAIKKLLPTIKKWIDESRDGIIRIKATDLAKDMGGDFAKKNYASIYWGLKYVLFKENIFVETVTHKSGDKLLIMRLRKSGDVLPPSLQKYIDEDNEEKHDFVQQKKMSRKELRIVLQDLPNYLQDTLNVYYHILDGMERGDATNLTAENRGVSTGTVMSGYTRSLDKSTSEIDILMQPENSKKFKNILTDKFPEHIDKINEFFSSI